MRNKTKIKYIPPQIHSITIELEQGVAAGSSKIIVGNMDSDNSPKIEEWIKSDLTENKDFDL